MAEIGENLAAVYDRIAAAAGRSGRDPAEITLLAVSKRIESQRIEDALAAGVEALGESRVQEAEAKIPTIIGEAEWHFIGPLQSNKATKAARLFDVVHSVRRSNLIPRLSRGAEAAGKTVRIYVQASPEPTPPTSQGIANAAALCAEVRDAEALQLAGLMAMAPYDPDPEAARPYFAHLRQLRDELAGRGFDNLGLSMGMSGDFEVAIEEGATIVRVGTAIFGERPS